MSAGPEVIFSGKHNGICIYFARILGLVNPIIICHMFLGHSLNNVASCSKLLDADGVLKPLNRTSSSHRNIWDGSLAVEKAISKGNQTVSIVSTITVQLHLFTTR